MQILNKKGFTLIELLVVIAIIGILASIMVVSLTNAQKKARDAKRQSELNQMRTALTLYADDNNEAYPTVDGDTCSDVGAGCVGPTATSIFDTVVADNPVVPEYMATALAQVGNPVYAYFYDYTAGPPDTYRAYVKLEAPPADTWYCVDSTGKAQTQTADPTAAGATMCN